MSINQVLSLVVIAGVILSDVAILILAGQLVRLRDQVAEMQARLNR